MISEQLFKVSLIDTCSSSIVDSCLISREDSNQKLYKSALSKLQLESNLSDFYSQQYGNRHILKNKHCMFSITIEID
jgi:hypothetical protein